MKNYIAFLTLISLFCSCVKMQDQHDPNSGPYFQLREEEKGLIGQWQEYGMIVNVQDSSGNIIGTADLNSLYRFNEDFTFTVENDGYLNASDGTWSFDTLRDIIAINPNVYPHIPANWASRKHLWAIFTLDSTHLDISHDYGMYSPGGSDTIWTSYYRKFTKL